MTLSPLPIDLTATQALDVAHRSAGPSLEAAQEQFEGVFLSLLLKEMRKTVGEGVFGGDAADTIGGLFDLTLGQELGRRGGLGITEALARYQQADLADIDFNLNSGGEH